MTEVTRFWRQPSKAALVGALAAVPALILCFGGFLHSAMGISWLGDAIQDVAVLRFLTHPVLVMGGLVLALGLNLQPVLSLRLEGDVLVGRFCWKGRMKNLVLVLAGTLLFLAILIYGFVENYRVLRRQ